MGWDESNLFRCHHLVPSFLAKSVLVRSSVGGSEPSKQPAQVIVVISKFDIVWYWRSYYFLQTKLPPFWFLALVSQLQTHLKLIFCFWHHLHWHHQHQHNLHWHSRHRHHLYWRWQHQHHFLCQQHIQISTSFWTPSTASWYILYLHQLENMLIGCCIKRHHLRPFGILSEDDWQLGSREMKPYIIRTQFRSVCCPCEVWATSGNFVLRV